MFLNKSRSIEDNMIILFDILYKSHSIEDVMIILFEILYLIFFLCVLDIAVAL